jgi:predicted DNA-binding transcriptional regulator AlpA
MYDFYTVDDVCRMFNIGRTTIMDRWSNPKSKQFNGFPTPVRLGISRPGERYRGRVGFRKAEVDAWVQARLDGHRAPPKEEQLPL